MMSQILQNGSKSVNETDYTRELNALFRMPLPELNTLSTPESGEEQDNGANVFSEDTKNILHIAVVVVAYMVGVMGVITNIINMTVYNKFGLKEGMNMGLFSLAVSDFVVAILFLGCTTCYFLAYVDPTNDVDPKSLLYLLGGSPRATCLGISALTTAIISLERCVCVVRPLKVKILFSRKRSIIIFISIYLFNILSYLPITLTACLAWQFDPNLNRTRLLLKLYDHRESVETASDIVNGAIVPGTVHIMVITSGVILISKLRKAAKFRSTALGTRMLAFSITGPSVYSGTRSFNGSLHTQQFDLNGKTSEAPVRSIESGSGRNAARAGESTGRNSLSRHVGNDNYNHKSMSRKDTSMVKIVIILVIIHLTCNSPGLVYSFLRLCVSDLHLTKRLAEVYDLLFAIVFILEGISGSANMLVYYKISSRYRQIFTRTFLCKTRESLGTWRHADAADQYPNRRQPIICRRTKTPLKRT